MRWYEIESDRKRERESERESEIGEDGWGFISSLGLRGPQSLDVLALSVGSSPDLRLVG